MSILKKLAGQTAIYGIPSIVGRLINFLLVFLFTEYFKPEIFAAHTEFYAYAAFFLVLLPHGMETAFFNFLRRGEELSKVFTTTIVSVLSTGGLFLVFCWVFAGSIADFMEYPSHPEYVRWFAFILFADVLAMLPFAKLRHLQKAKKFAMIRSANIVLNIGFNILFIVFFPIWFSGGNWFYDPSIGIGYVFIANLIASVLTMLMLLPTTLSSISVFDKELWIKMLKYSWPLVFVGLAGIVNETLDRAVMGKLLTGDQVKFEIGVYGAFYKLSIIVTLFIQAFRYAAEPFFFERAKEQDAKKVYASVMNYFVAVCMLIALATLVFLNDIAPLAIRQQAYFDHPDALKIVPILLLANIFLGVIYNLSIWYKVEEKTTLGAAISIGGAVLTVILLLSFIPTYGFIAAAYTTLIVYFLMSVASYIIGQKYYPVPYEINKLSVMFFSAIILYLLDKIWLTSLYSTIDVWILYMIKAAIVMAYSAIVYRVVIRGKKP